MKPLRRLTNLLAACAVAAAAFGQPALAADLAQDPFITDNTQRQHYEPGGKYHLFGDPRGSVSDRTGKINVIQDYTHQMGNLLIQQANINGTIGYHTRFSGHGHEEHAPFDNHAADSASKEQGNVDDGFTVYRLNWEGHEHHPADAYDGPKGGNYPKPTGARDEYTYHVNGTARSIKLNPTDTRDVRQRISDNYSNLGSNFSDRADEANRKMFEHNAKLDRWGNSMEFINGVAAGALNPFISAGEAVDQWMQENPNAAETVEALVNVLPFAKVKNLTKAAKPGKAAVSGDFSAAYNTRTTRKVTTETEGLNRIRQNQKNSNIHEKNYGRDNPNHINVLSGNSIQHILYGDEAGGGHLFPGKPGKTTFPQHWSASKITHEISDIVTSPKTQWYAQTGTGGKYIAKGRPARWVSYETRDGIRIRTVYEPATGKVVTAFPDRTSNPKYNPVK
ncbi:MafB family polymorphic toxin [Neisseria meningitidis]|uniref:MafB family polymorphic toxin n=1 Tax=Neisseria meningitidis TaxID=487 RepID=UPI001EDD8F85|nr:MafB family polymorphic toxin [Neisseria meningitidis]MCG3363780.1 MafB family polymorphic toxin [Neisseria meningitidis]